MHICELLEAKQFSQDIVQQMAELYAQGHTLKQIGQKYGVGKSCIFRYLENLPNWSEIQNQHQLYTMHSTRGKRKGITSMDVQQMAQLYSQGQSSYQIAKQFGISPTVVRRHLQNLDDWQKLSIMKMARSPNPALGVNKGTSPQDVEKMAQLYMQGQSFKEIGSQFNLSVTNVHRHLSKLPNWKAVRAANRQARPKPAMPIPRAAKKTLSLKTKDTTTSESASNYKFVRPGELRGSYSKQQMEAMGFKLSTKGQWFIRWDKWHQLVRDGKIR